MFSKTLSKVCRVALSSDYVVVKLTLNSNVPLNHAVTILFLASRPNRVIHHRDCHFYMEKKGLLRWCH